MGKRAHNPYIPVTDAERLTRASHVLKAAIVALEAKHVNTYTMLQPGKSVCIDLSHPMEAAHSLIEKVIGHRRDRKRVIAAQRKVPDKFTPSITWQLLQVLHMLKVTIYAYESEPDPADELDFSYPLRAIVALLEQAHDELYEEDDKKFVARNPKLMREAELARVAPGQTGPAAGKP